MCPRTFSTEPAAQPNPRSDPIVPGSTSSTLAALRRPDRGAESADGGGCLEHEGSRAGRLAYTPDSVWRNRAEFLTGREAIRQFLARKWAKELDYRLIKELWASEGARIAVRFAYEWHDDSGNWYRSYGNENWEFDDQGFMKRRIASINDLPIAPADRKYHWPLGRRPDDHPGLSDLGL